MSNISHTNCPDNLSLSDDERKVLVTIWSSGGFAGVLSCSTGLALLVFFKMYKRFSERLFLYLLLSGLFVASAISSMIAGVVLDFAHHSQLCQAIGFFVEYSICILLLVTTFVTFHLALLVLFHRNFEKLELFYVLFSCIFPLLFVWVPFLHDRYGLAGAWCWIRALDHDDCSFHRNGVIEQFALWYGPLFVMLILNFVFIIAISVVLCYKAFRKTADLKAAIAKQGEPTKNQKTVIFQESTNPEASVHEADQYKVALKRSIPLLAYPIIFNISSWFPIINRFWRGVSRRNDSFIIWVGHAVSSPSWAFFVGGTFIIYVIVKKKFTKENIRIAADSWKHTFKRKRRSYVQFHDHMPSAIHPGTNVFTAEGYTVTSPTTWDPDQDGDLESSEGTNSA